MEGNLKRILVFIPSQNGLIDTRTVEGIMELCFEAASLKDYLFYIKIGNRMFIENARNFAVEYALDNNFDYVLFFDDDMVVMTGSHLLKRLIEAGKDIVAPLFFTRNPPYLPLLFNRVVRANGTYHTYDHIANYIKGLVKCDAVGFGCVLIKTEVFKKIGSPYFVFTSLYGEDMYFCGKATSAGYEIYCDTSLNVGHIGDPPIVTEDNFVSTKKNTETYLEQKKVADDVNSKKYENKADIIMPIYHNFEVTKSAIDSILNNTVNANVNLILVNDGADREVRNYVKSLKKFRKNIIYIENKVNIGWVQSVNQGLKLSSAPYIVITNNDIEIPINMAHWLSRFCSMLRLDDKLGAVAPVSNYVMGLQNQDYNSKIIATEHYSKLIIGFFFCIKREVYEKIGGLDEVFGTGGNDDLDYSIRIAQAGYKMKIARDIFIYHAGSKSLPLVCGGMEGVKKLDEETRKLLVNKWGQDKVTDLFTYNEKYLVTGES